jgi:hypothetical protein
MKVFRLHVQGQHVGEQRIERAGNVAHSVGLKIAGRVERCRPPSLRVLNVHSPMLLFEKL